MKAKYFNLIFIVTVFDLNGQANPNPEFISSLPPNIRADFLSEISKTYKDEPDKVFKAPDSSIDKVESEIEKLQIQLSELEERFKQSRSNNQILIPFGRSFFNSYQSSFMPINEPTFLSEYILDAGDTLKVQLVGSENDLYSLVVRRDGAILIPTVGAVNVAGLSLDIASKLISSTVEQKFLGTQAYVNLTNLRDINVLVTGNVNSPGIYTVSGGSSVLSVLNSAGGINDNGSFRNIHVKRNGKKIAEIDLYDVFIQGNLAFNRLRSGDAIIVNSVLPTVSISGGISRPAVYEITPDNKLGDILDYAGGILPGYSTNLTIYRHSSDASVVLDIKSTEYKDYNLRHGDSIKVSSYLPTSKIQKSVYLTGEVKKPGKYNIIDGQNLSDLIIEAGGYTDNAYEMGGKLIRESAKKMEREINTRIYNEMIKFIATSPLAKNIISGGSSALPLILSEFKNVEATGRIAAEFDLTQIRRDPSLDTILTDGDRIHIPAFSQEIYVLGEVIAPGTRLFNTKTSVKEYLAESGGITAFGDNSRVIIIRPNGNAYISNSSIFNYREETILPGSVIYVPREIGKLDGVNLAAVIAPIFSSLAISLASLNSISQ